MGTKTWFEDGKVVTQHLTAKDIYKEPEQEPVVCCGDYATCMKSCTPRGRWLAEQEPVAWMCCAFDGKVCEQSNHDECENPIPLYTTPPKRERVVFPTMLRKMWSGGEVQAWLDENVNKEKNT